MIQQSQNNNTKVVARLILDFTVLSDKAVRKRKELKSGELKKQVSAILKQVLGVSTAINAAHIQQLEEALVKNLSEVGLVSARFTTMTAPTPQPVLAKTT